MDPGTQKTTYPAERSCRCGPCCPRNRAGRGSSQACLGITSRILPPGTPASPPGQHLAIAALTCRWHQNLTLIPPRFGSRPSWERNEFVPPDACSAQLERAPLSGSVPPRATGPRTVTPPRLLLLLWGEAGRLAASSRLCLRGVPK